MAVTKVRFVLSPGYVNCTCRDCFDTAIQESADDTEALCFDCVENGCTANGGECLCPDAYGAVE